MKIITKRKINKAVDEIIDAVLDNTDYDVDVMGPHDYDVMMFVNKTTKPQVEKLIYEILTDKKNRKWWKLVNVAIRRTK